MPVSHTPKLPRSATKPAHVVTLPIARWTLRPSIEEPFRWLAQNGTGFFAYDLVNLSYKTFSEPGVFDIDVDCMHRFVFTDADTAFQFRLRWC